MSLMMMYKRRRSFFDRLTSSTSLFIVGESLETNNCSIAVYDYILYYNIMIILDLFPSEIDRDSYLLVDLKF